MFARPSRLDRKIAMLLSFERAIAAFADTAVRQRQADADNMAGLAEAVAQFLMAVHGRMPGYLRTPFRALMLIFDAWPILFKGKAFHRLGPSARAAQVRAWTSSRIEVRRRLMEFYDSLALFGLYSELYGQDYRYE